MLEGSEGLDVSCSNSENDTVIVFDKVQRTTLTKWTERLEVWIPWPAKRWNLSIWGTSIVHQQTKMGKILLYYTSIYEPELNSYKTFNPSEDVGRGPK